MKTKIQNFVRALLISLLLIVFAIGVVNAGGGNLAFRKNKITVEAVENMVELPADWKNSVVTDSDTPSFILKSVDSSSSLDVIKQIRAYSGLGLKDAKTLVDTVKAGTEQKVSPKTGLTKDEADAVFSALNDYDTKYSKIGDSVSIYSIKKIAFSKLSVPANATAMESDGLYYTFDATTGALVFYASDSKKINAPKDSSNLFSELSSVTDIDFSNFSTIGVVNMQGMFLNFGGVDWIDDGTGIMMSENFPKKLDLNSFDTSDVTNMSGMFSSCSASEIIVSKFNTEKVINMSEMFANCSFIISLDLSNFNTSNVTNMSVMFSGSRISSLNICNFNFENVTDASYMLGSELSSGMVGNETIINEIVLPALSKNISIKLYPSDSYHYALEENPKNAILELDSNTNAKGQTLKLYYNDTYLEVPWINTSTTTTEETGIVADALSIFIVSMCFLGVAIISIRKKKYIKL